MDNWTPVTPSSGGSVHMTSLTDCHKTQCGKICAGWVIALKAVDCQKCKAAVHKKVKIPK